MKALGIVRSDLGYHGEVQMWWKLKELSLEDGLFYFVGDKDASLLSDCTKQYTLLWSFSVALTKKCKENTCQTKLDRLTLDVEPRFQRFYMCLDGCKKAFKSACRPCYWCRWLSS